MALVIYLSYFEIYVAPTIANRPENRRLWAKRNEVLRGTIYDRNGTPLTKSTRIDYETQKREYTGGEVLAFAPFRSSLFLVFFLTIFLTASLY
jgi:peptidoglycan glycosyltransferase